jgi:hypothetical protein
MRPLAQPDGHDLPGAVDKGIPSVAAVIDDIVVGFEDAVGDSFIPSFFEIKESAGA